MKKRILSLLLTLCLVLSLAPVAAFAVKTSDFKDISEDDWYYEYVDFVTTKGYFYGTSGTTFEPDTTMTRAMFVTVLARLDGAKVDDSVSTFTDVPANTWYTGATTWAAEKGIVLGVGNNKFEPETPITREQMCVIMDRYVTYYGSRTNQAHKTEGSKEAFPDAAKISDFAVKAVANCRLYGLVEGCDDGSFHPQDNSTRAQVATVIYRLAWLVKSSGGGGGGSTTYTLVYHGGGGTFAAGTGVSEDGTELTVTQRNNNVFKIADVPQLPTYPGYTFKGWNDKDGNPVVDTYTVSSGTRGDLYAAWDPEGEPEYEYYAKVALTAPDGVLPDDFEPVLQSIVGEDKTIDTVVKELVTGENESVLKEGIGTALDKAAGQEVTRTVRGETVTVAVSAEGVVSATTTMKVTHIIDASNDAAVTLNAYTNDEVKQLLAGIEIGEAEVETLLEKLESAKAGEALSLTVQDAAALDVVLEKAAEVPNMSDADIQARIDKFVNGNTAMEQMFEGVTVDAIRNGVDEYADTLEGIQADVHDEIAKAIENGDVVVENGSITSSITAPAATVTAPETAIVVTVAVDLGAYLEKAQNKIDAGIPERVNNAIAKVEAKLELTEAQKAAVEEAVENFYNLDKDLAQFVTDNGDGTLSLLGEDAYYDVLVKNVNAACDLWTALSEAGADTTFYNDLIAKAEGQVGDVAGVDPVYTRSVIATILGTSEGGFMANLTKGLAIPTDGNKAGYQVLSVTVDAKAAYADLADKLADKLTETGRDNLADLIPENIPEKLEGTYTLTITVYKQVKE